MEKRKVLIIHNVIAPYRLPLFELLCADSKIDLEVLYCSTGTNLFRWDVSPREYNYCFKVLPCVTRKLSYFNPTVIFEICKRKPDVIIVDGYVDLTMQLAYALGKILTIPVILWIEGVMEPRSLLGMFTRPLRMFFIKQADAIIVPGRLSKDYVISMGGDKSKVFIAPNSIDNDFFIKHTIEYKKNRKRLKKVLRVKKQKGILYVGQLIERKAVDRLVRAYARLRKEREDVALIIVGSGPLRNQLEHMCQANCISDVCFIDAGLKLVDLIKYYSVADVFVLPTLFDVWGFVINEAMACGLPVVSTRNAQAAVEMIHQGENGLIVKEASEEELYSAMKKILGSNGFELMGKKSLEIVSTQFDPSLMKEEFVAAISYALRFNLKL